MVTVLVAIAASSLIATAIALWTVDRELAATDARLRELERDQLERDTDEWIQREQFGDYDGSPGVDPNWKMPPIGQENVRRSWEKHNQWEGSD